MNIVLNTPLPVFAAAKQEYDDKILFFFLILMSILIILGLVFVNFARELSNNRPPNTYEQVAPSKLTEYV